MIQLVFDTTAPISKVTLSSDVMSPFELRTQAQEHLTQLYGNAAFDFYLLHNGKPITDKNVTTGDVHVVPKLVGGKGGFGSMLRAIGAQIEKTTNREACRDLSGRRLRDINEEKRLKKWIAEQAEREQEALKRKRKKLERLNEEIKHDFKDEEYTKARLEMPDKIHEAVEQGLKAAVELPEPSEPVIEAKVKEVSKKKKTKGKLWVDDLLDDSEASSESEEESPKKKMKVS